MRNKFVVFICALRKFYENEGLKIKFSLLMLHLHYWLSGEERRFRTRTALHFSNVGFVYLFRLVDIFDRVTTHHFRYLWWIRQNKMWSYGLEGFRRHITKQPRKCIYQLLSVVKRVKNPQKTGETNLFH